MSDSTKNLLVRGLSETLSTSIAKRASKSGISKNEWCLAVLQKAITEDEGRKVYELRVFQL